jgi:hypothetical protein
MKFFEKEFNPPKYLLDLDIENLYHILYEKQQKELEKQSSSFLKFLLKSINFFCLIYHKGKFFSS